ncbi:MAG: sulfatase [Planctomycetes bacterium]|nr:sulfatase [Planctomycetota bacterium]
MSIARRVLTVLLAVVAACDSSSRPRAQGPNVILICMDTVRADHVGWNGYTKHATTPRLDRLAAEALVFADATATAGSTRPSVPSFLTGTYPLQHGLYGREGDSVAPLADDANTLAEAFDAAGWHTGAFVYNPQLARGNGFEQGFRTWQDQQADALSIRTRAEAWLDELPDDEPFFLYLHFLDAHWPYPIPEEYATKFADAATVAPFQGPDSWALITAIGTQERPTSETELDGLRALYDGGIRYIDDQLAVFFDELERSGEWNDTVVCVLADHGEEFMEHGRIGHGHGLWENLLRVPWIVRIPGAAAERVDVPVSLVDVFPTLLAAAGVPVPSSNEGIDRLRDRTTRTPIFAELKEEQSYQQALRSGEHKLVRRLRRAAGTDPNSPFKREEIAEMVRRGTGPAARVFDLATDPGEHDAKQGHELAPELEKALDGFGKDLLKRVRYRDGERREMDAAEVERLRQLGY